jgi:2,4-dienoyl-CoA reductase-like NADH-dependent reductase (Old Yellow Enzyme family)
MTTPSLFTPLTFRELTLRNRIGVSPMCQYSATDGFVSDWHMPHIGAFATGGAGLIIMEMTAVVPEGRITPGCLGLWKDEHIPALSRITAFAKSQGAAIGIQIAHAGRKASMDLPWKGGKRLLPGEGGWPVVAPSAIPFQPDHAPPAELSQAAIGEIRDAFVATALRAVKAGFQVIELHGAHGYLLHQFLSPLSNRRKDVYGQDRRRLINEIAEEVRRAVPKEIVLGARLSCIDWVEGGITLEDSIETARQLKKRGVDFVDCSSGALVHDAKMTVGPGYQAPFAKAVRDGAGVPTAAVGMITTPRQAEEIVAGGSADFVLIAREHLRDPHFALRAAKELGAQPPAPPQYLRAYA